MKPEEAVTGEYDEREMQIALLRLEKRELDRAGLVALGRKLATLLLPPATEGAPGNVRGLFAGSLLRLGANEGLRLQVRLPARVGRLALGIRLRGAAGGGDGMDGFLALDPRITPGAARGLRCPLGATSRNRHDPRGGRVRLPPSDLRLLDLEQESRN